MKNLKKYISFPLCFLFSLFTVSVISAQISTPEASIHKAYSASQKQMSLAPIVQLNKELDTAFQKEDTSFNRYWFSYGLYMEALCADQQNKKTLAEERIDQAIALLQPLEEDPESLALLSMQLGYSTRFKNSITMMRLGRKAYLNAERAVALDPENLRTNLSLAINDFYTPKIFGGGKKVESLLLKALEDNQPNSSDNLPTWGKVNVYDILVQYYRQNENQKKALYYLEKGRAEFPESNLLKALIK